MKEKMLAVGHGVSLLVGCGQDSGYNKPPDEDSAIPQQTEKNQQTICVDDDGLAAQSKISSRFVIKSCEFVGQTEFFRGDSSEAEIVVLTFGDKLNSRILECMAVMNHDDRAGMSFDCNWDAYNQPE